ncbi:leucine-rich repeat domain-containing protein [uncultured Croceitalea sp.]|uniref:leucine-rich repeat domain-containing protein n=1 Tax=uncultured Croceitalea sp. TaxID=1798908 RepID=UPI0033058C4E
MKKIVVFALGLVVFISCNNDENSSLNTLIAFTILAKDNDGFQEDITASIDRTNQTIVITVPYEVDLTALKPTLLVSDGATVRPTNKEATDFSKPLAYIVTAADGTETGYPVVIVFQSDDKKVLKDIYEANPDSGLEWSFDDDTSYLEGVTFQNGRVEELNLYPKKLKKIPSSIGRLTELRSLILHSSDLESIPDEIQVLAKLELLGLDDNNFTSFPFAVTKLAQLKHLSLKNNALKHIPEALDNLTDLESLHLEDNNIVSLPVEIRKLKKLKDLYLQNNKITQLPVEIGALTNLENLYLTSNKLTVLPKEIGDVQHLKHLNLFNNKLNSLPVELAELEFMMLLNIQQNPLRKIPKAICEMPISSFYRELNVVCEE